MRALVLLGVGLLLNSAREVGLPAVESAIANENRTPSGRLRNGVLTLQLEARQVAWYPESDNGVAIPTFAFAEVGKRASVPGPMIRVPVGTEINASVRNALAKPLLLGGLRSRGTAGSDSIVIEPGGVHTATFRADAAGTFYYWGRTETLPLTPGPGFGRDAALVGAFIVDSSQNAPPARERVLVFTGVSDTIAALGVKSDAADRVLRREAILRANWAVFAVNGKSWPHTERLSYRVGDTVSFRLINGGRYPHPMHLHGFYFTVNARGDARRDTAYALAMRREAVTEWMPGGTTMRMTWVPTRAGNWLFHCHLVTHMSDVLRLTPAPHSAKGHANHAEGGMAGLVTGIHVAPARGVTLAADPASRRRLRLFITERQNVYGDRPALSYVLQNGAPPKPDSILTPSSTLVLRQGEPTEITVVNVMTQATSVHWHGVELESFYDGVGDWSGWGTRTAGAIAPGDSFVVRITPPRAGTFIYHTHVDEAAQLASGLYGTLLVLPENGIADTTERVFLIGMGGPNDEAPPVINGVVSPGPVELRAGVRHRLRLINISPMETRTVQLVSGDSVLQWRPVAKDGAELAPAQAVLRPATITTHAGETYDFEVMRERPETLTLRVSGAGSIVERLAYFTRVRAPGAPLPRVVVNIPILVK